MTTDEVADRRTAALQLTARMFAGAGARPALPATLAKHTIDHVFGEVWLDPSLALEQRSLITCAVLIATGREAEQRLHFRGARNLGITRETLEAVITHVAHYAGWPVAVSASGILAEVWAEMDAQG